MTHNPDPNEYSIYAPSPPGPMPPSIIAQGQILKLARFAYEQGFADSGCAEIIPKAHIQTMVRGFAGLCQQQWHIPSVAYAHGYTLGLSMLEGPQREITQEEHDQLHQELAPRAFAEMLRPLIIPILGADCDIELFPELPDQ